MSLEEEATKFMSDKEKQADQINGLTCQQEVALRLTLAVLSNPYYFPSSNDTSQTIREAKEAAKVLLKD